MNIMDNNEKCAFETKRGACVALNKKECAGCHFYKTHSQIEKQKEKRKIKNLFLVTWKEGGRT